MSARTTDTPRHAGQSWPVLRTYDQDHVGRIALPLGGIGTGTVSLGGRGDLRDWELMNRPAKGFVPGHGRPPFFAIRTVTANGRPQARALEGPIEPYLYEGASGCAVPNHGLPRFHTCRFSAAYPFGQVHLADRNLPVRVLLQAFNPLLPTDPDRSGLPVAVLRYVVTNVTDEPLDVTVCGTIPNFIGVDGSAAPDVARYHPGPAGVKDNRSVFRQGTHVRGMYMYSDGVSPQASQWGTMALSTRHRGELTYRTAWASLSWGDSLLDFWDDFLSDGRLEDRDQGGQPASAASLAATLHLAPAATDSITFLLTWHFPNRYTWSPQGGQYTGNCGGTDSDCRDDLIGNYYTTRFADAWDAAERIAPELDELERDTLSFVQAVLDADLPAAVKEAALFNLSTLRTQTCFRTADGRFYGWEGCCDQRGCCHGSCTHVWNYEQATAFLFGSLVRSMREVEFAHATDGQGRMSFRVHLPLARAQAFGKAAADGQMGCIMKLYRDWQLSGDNALLETLWPHARKALEFCWIEGGWDADRDGVMEGCQHNTMDVEYYGPNPQMGTWYLGALRAAEEMARHLDESAFADTCRELFEKGRTWLDAKLFNGDYYEHEIRPPGDATEIAPGLRLHMGAGDLAEPELQLGRGCLVDQLVGQFMAHVCGLGYLLEPDHVRTTLASIYRYNLHRGFYDHANHMRSFVMGDETGLLMAAYPRGDRPRRPFPYYTEVMTGFEYCAAVHMLYEDMVERGLECIANIRSRYDGRKRSPFDEAECGHHYARAMASWAAVLALSGFHYSAVTGEMTFRDGDATHVWSTGDAWGTCRVTAGTDSRTVTLSAAAGSLSLRAIRLRGVGTTELEQPRTLSAGDETTVTVPEP